MINEVSLKFTLKDKNAKLTFDIKLYTAHKS